MAEKKIRKHPVLRAVLFTVLGLWVAVILVLQIALNGAVLTSLANRFVPRFVDADVSFGRISASMFRSFPYLNVTVDSLAVTYPHDRFAALDSLGAPSFLRKLGRGAKADTLLSVRQLSASVNYLTLLHGRIRVRRAHIDGPRIFAHQYDSTAANWDIFHKDTTETDGSGLPPVTLLSASLTGRPLVVFTAPSDTIFASMRMRRLIFRGKAVVDNIPASRFGLELDTLFVTGRLPADTLALGLDRIRMNQREDYVDFDAAAKAFLALSSVGRMAVPIQLEGKFGYPRKDGYQTFFLQDFKARVATLDLHAEGEAVLHPDSTYIKGNAGIDRCKIDELIAFLGPNFPELKRIKTDAAVTLTARCDGWYIPAGNRLPAMEARLEIPRSVLAYEGVAGKGTIDMDLTALTDGKGRLDANLKDLCLGVQGLDLQARGKVRDVLGRDPLIDLNADIHANMGDLTHYLPDSLDISASGRLDGNLYGKIRLSQLNLYHFSESNLRGKLESGGITVDAPRYGINAFLDHAVLSLGPVPESKDSTVGLTASIDSLRAVFRDSTFIRGTGLVLAASNRKKALDGRLTVRSLGMMDADSCFVGAFGMQNSFRYAEEGNGRLRVPEMSFSSNSRAIFMRQGVNRFGVRDAKISASARRRAVRDAIRRKHLLDSLERVYPGVPRDSLFARMFRDRLSRVKMPDYLSDKDFQDKDIDLRLGESLAKYFREWALSGKLEIGSGRIMTPYFPLRNELSDIGGTFTNDGITLRNATLQSGGSDVSANGSITGLQRALTGRRTKGHLNLDLRMTSQRLDANELLTAYFAGTQFIAPTKTSPLENLSDEEYQRQLDAENEASPEPIGSPLIVIPANLTAKVSLQANEIEYSDLNINWMASDILMKERCIQLTNTLATSNMGDIYFEGFYSTRTKKDLKAGFDLTLSDITADKVITLFPAVDSILPMLKSFKGMLDCEMAATADIDTSMNIIMPSVDGIIKLSGTNLELEESGELREIAKTLMFKNRSGSTIEDMSVQGIIRDDLLEVFPFVLSMDRYSLAMSGIQHFDQRFQYHISVLKSPLPFRFGINIFGNFDSWKWKLGKALYKSADVPVFTAEVDTLKYNLINSIHNIFTRGVDIALERTRALQDSIAVRKEQVGLVRDYLSQTADAQVDTLMRSRLDSLKAGRVVVEALSEEKKEDE